ncbi:hypothetical protein [Mycolicibacterium fluoranthenivorans]|uniref:Uncharacterized protein n=1 Tax=Mycolicibacterium fluoranthenivorans TaxID=258505 RepID=A0A7X5U1P4_9MYCO|nr:hypothetical protein [Mycolicibacterium fluoranthenivorans]MCV7359698.1 hypothetical protein [Mycolicibacterium fluoranthenivorans]NIH96765.1 hypothetical protein [Mycolicibacterium fluoranthenivorans]
MAHARRNSRGSGRYGFAVLAVGMALSAGTGHGVAWAETGQQDSPDTSSSPATPAKADSSTEAPEAEPNPAAPQKAAVPDSTRVSKPKFGSHSRSSRTHDSATTADATSDAMAKRAASHPEPPATDNSVTPQSATATKPDTGVTAVVVTAPTAKTTKIAKTAVAGRLAAVTTVGSADSVTTTTPSPPKPLSPIAKIAALPGKIINAVLQLLDFTVAAGGPHSPFNFRPIDEALFGVFRRIEDVLGLSKAPVVQQYPPAEIYSGPISTKTPTVAQFLNAATAEYVLGGTPGGLKPFPVNGVQMASTNILSGMRSQVWVTPDNQLIIAYQGTTGGTNLLANPLMAVSQLVADLQVIFTNTTPQAFWDALHFQRRVQTQAALQGYSSDDIFVTGHSLGGWEAEFVAQQDQLGGIGFESPGLNTKKAGNGRNSGFVNVETYGDPAAYMATDLPGLQPFMPKYVPGGGSKPHYGSIVMIGDPKADYPLINSSALFGKSVLGSLLFAGDFLVNFLGHHLPGQQAYNLDVDPDPGVVPWLGYRSGPVDENYGELTIPQLQIAASGAGKLFAA